MTTLRPRSALRLLAALILCAPLTACDDKKTRSYGPTAGNGVARNVTGAPAVNPNAPKPAEQGNT